MRTLLYRLRAALPDDVDFLDTNASTVQWQPTTSFALDVTDLESAATRVEQAEQSGNEAAIRAALEQTVDLYRGDLLPSCYEDWILAERERLYQIFLVALERLIELLENQRNYSKAIVFAERRLRNDPLRETSYQQLMRLNALNGDPAKALHYYHTCATVLERELEVEPSPATQDIYERLIGLELPNRAPSTPAIASVPLVGREQAWEQLQSAWRGAVTRRSHFVTLVGEAGIGKTRLAEEMLQWADRQGIRTARVRCYAAEGSLAFTPVVLWLRTKVFQETVRSLDEVLLTEVARLLPELLVERPDLSPPAPLIQRWQRQRLFEALARAVLGSSSQPLLLVLDDLQWCDRDTLEWLHYLLRFDAEAQLLVVGSLRSEEIGTNHPLAMLLPELQRNRGYTEIELDRLDEAQTTSLAAQMLGEEYDSGQSAYLSRETEGIPLFVVETVRAGGGLQSFEQNDQLEQSERLEPKSFILPPKVQRIIEARLAQLSNPARELVSVAATIGRAFNFAVLTEASDEDEESLIGALDEIWQRRLVSELGEHGYDFSHDKILAVAYSQVSHARRRRLHQQVAQALESVHANELDTAAGQVAVHYERSGMPENAIPYYQLAADAALRLSAHQEASRQLTHGLQLLMTLPDTAARMQQEIIL